MDTQTLPGSGGVRIRAHITGDSNAPALLLLHALGDRATDWSAATAALAPYFRVIALDLRGHGDSDWPGKYSFELMADDVAAVLDVLDLNNVVVIGHSMGGVVAYILAQTQPDRIARLIIEDAPPPFPRTRPLPARPSGELLFDWDVVPAIASQVNDPSLRWWRHLSDITAPTLLIGGGTSSHVPQELLSEVAGLIPDCTVVTLDAGHNVHHNAPEDFNTTVLQWLGSANETR
ncbi:alpha/beta hydrolase [Paenarthrobacter nitroguajacolicus]|uniref:Alpha/beta hydrolase n=1 Tax=Paenarthrobacter nitroguajacolicus TaxID=211146 RepID=A0A558H8K8_PAENT|nr:alpha/beta hydrolase [Paenarthrobacter nitroguajacolicus]TVU65457.1 alpha/beta hydrolase [Paenarthrobacter nitroguajacolicus]